MKKAIVLALVAVLASLLVVGCAATEESAPVGSTIRLVDPDGDLIEMHEAASLNSPVIAQFPVDFECEVLSEPRTAGDVTIAKLSCSGGTLPESGGGIEVFMIGWVNVTNIEVLD